MDDLTSFLFDLADFIPGEGHVRNHLLDTLQTIYKLLWFK